MFHSQPKIISKMFNKLTITLCVAFAIFAMASAAYISSARISQVGKSAVGPLALTGFTDCGVSTLVDVRLTGCTNAPCQMSANTQYTFEVDFRPRDFHWDLTHRGIIIKEIELFLLSEGRLEDSTVEAGQLYTFTYNFQTPAALSGQTEFRIIAHQNWVQEICLIIPFNF